MYENITLDGLTLHFPANREGKNEAIHVTKCLIEKSVLNEAALKELLERIESQDWHLVQ